MSIFETLQATDLPCAYANFKRPIVPPYLVYLGDGQDIFDADNKIYYKRNRYQIEYYFKQKNEANESAIEEALSAAGYRYEKSEDVYIDSLECYLIYYNV